jgi:hypothetical protein
VNTIARDLKLSHSTVSTILKDKERIREAVKGSALDVPAMYGEIIGATAGAAAVMLVVPLVLSRRMRVTSYYTQSSPYFICSSFVSTCDL